MGSGDGILLDGALVVGAEDRGGDTGVREGVSSKYASISISSSSFEGGSMRTVLEGVSDSLVITADVSVHLASVSLVSELLSKLEEEGTNRSFPLQNLHRSKLPPRSVRVQFCCCTPLWRFLSSQR